MTDQAPLVAARPALEVADIVRLFGEALRQTYPLTPEQSKVLRAIALCRTAALGGHLDVCDECGFSRPSYNSCRNRHCPKCQAMTAAEWLEGRQQRILPVPHFHVVFTLPAQLHPLVAFRRAELFDVLFSCASATLTELAACRLRLGLGVTMVLHTWTRDLRWHPHVHALVTAGGLSLDGSAWLAQPDFLLPVLVMGKLFRGKFLAALRALHAKGTFAGFDDFLDPEGFDRLMGKLATTSWVVYAKRPFGAAEHVLSYLGRYTHRVGISNRRLLSLEGDQVTLGTKNGQTATMSGVEFLHRFVQHVLPKGFVKIRHYGLYASSHVHTLLTTARSLLPAPVARREEIGAGGCAESEPRWKVLLREWLEVDVDLCPHCGGRLRSHPLPERLDTS
jgi:hypothetical protein